MWAKGRNLCNEGCSRLSHIVICFQSQQLNVANSCPAPKSSIELVPRALGQESGLKLFQSVDPIGRASRVVLLPDFMGIFALPQTYDTKLHGHYISLAK